MQPKPFFCLLNVKLVQISGVAKFANGSMAEPEIPLAVTILDENDNPPYFELHSGNITEASKQGSARPFGFCLAGSRSIPARPCFEKARSDEMFVLLGFSTGTFVMQIEGKDNDQQGTINSQIAYSIVSQEPEGTHMFRIDETTGKLYVQEPTLDREVRI